MTEEAVKKVILVGEANPYGADPRYALYCDPPESAGGRLCHVILKMTAHQYLRTFDRTNLCPSKWSMPVARARAKELLATGAPLVLFGAKVCSAFGFAFVPYSYVVTEGVFLPAPILRLPHPSGLSRAWNEPGAYDRARGYILGLLESFTTAR